LLYINIFKQIGQNIVVFLHVEKPYSLLEYRSF